MSLWMSSGAFQTRDVAGVLAGARANGVTGVELSSGLAYSPDLLTTVRAAHDVGDLRFLVHNYFPPPEQPFVLNVAAEGEGLRQTRALCSRALHLAKDVGAPFYSIHAGFAATLRAEQLGRPAEQAKALSAADIDREGGRARMVETVRAVADEAADLGLRLLIENNVISPVYLEQMPINPLLLTQADECTAFFEEVARANVGLLLDVAHVKVSATAQGFDPHRFIETVADWVGCLHLSDNDGREDTNQPVRTDSWFVPHLKDFVDCPWVIEAYNLDGATQRSQLELLRGVKEQ